MRRIVFYILMFFLFNIVDGSIGNFSAIMFISFNILVILGIFYYFAQFNCTSRFGFTGFLNGI